MKYFFSKISIVLLFFICSSYKSNAQIVIGINSLSANLELEQDTQFNFKIYNLSSTDTVKFWWKLIKCDSYPYDNWETQVGDQILHYITNYDSCHTSKPNTLYPNDSTAFQIEFETNEFEGSCSLCLKLYSDKNFINEIASTNCNDLISVGTSSTKDKTISDILIYPNPASDFFSIKNDEEITSLKVYDVLGKLITSEKHKENQIHEIDLLKNGIYFIQTFDNYNNLKSSITIVKN